jgi:tRNA A-37 threonylcarbamoyl transferase component Bud32
MNRMAESLAHSPTLAAGTTTEDRLVAGALAGEYVVERFLGAGAMGEVYAGNHPALGKKVAIKVLRGELMASAEAAERFMREARAVNRVEHGNVVDVFAHGRLADGRLFLVMSFVAGKTLRARLADGPLALGDALAILAPIADALDAAHAVGVVHRDLKPDNIMVTDAGRVFVLDFGIAKLIAGEAGGAGTLTGRGTWLGTPAYMAPEQWSTDGAGPASDRYALGVIAFELLAGSHPFAAASVPAMMEQHFRAAVPALSERGVAAIGGGAIDEVLRRALAKDPDARFPSARTFVDALALAGGSGAQAAVAGVAPTRRSWLAPVLGVGVLGVAIGGVILVRHGDDRAAPAAVAPDVPPAGTITLEVTSTPEHALLALGDRVIGPTPIALHVAPNALVELRVTKPGYVSDHRTLGAGGSDSAIAIQLGEVTRFQGVWRLPTGELRAFERASDQVTVSKLDDVAGARHFYKRYPFVDAATGIAFAADDEVVDPRAPDDPSCHQPVHVVYHYDAATDALALDRPTVSVDFVAGHCVPRSQAVETLQLVRVDQGHDSVRLPAPVGEPKKRVRKTAPVPKPVAKQQQQTIDDTMTKKIDEPPTQVPPSNNANAPANQQIVPEPQQAIPTKSKKSPAS